VLFGEFNMKTYSLYSFADWVKSVGGQTKAAELLNVQQGQISRWVTAGACISADGTVYPPTSSKYDRKPIDLNAI